jgi:hypothetical protein
MSGVAPAELERDAAEDQREQHRDDRRVQRRHQDRVTERERGHQAATAEHQPCFVAVPDRRDRVHRDVALRARLERREQDADAEIEAVHHDVREDCERDDARPHDREVGHVSHAVAYRCRGCTRAAATAGAGVMPAVRVGRPGPCSGPDSPRAGDWAMSLSRYQTPTPNTAK